MLMSSDAVAADAAAAAASVVVAVVVVDWCCYLAIRFFLYKNYHQKCCFEFQMLVEMSVN